MLLDRFRSDLATDAYSPETVASYSYSIGLFARWVKTLGLEGPEKLTAAVLSDYRRHLGSRTNLFGRKNSAAAVNTQLIALRRFFRYLVDLGLVARSLLSRLSCVRAPKLLPRSTPGHSEIMKLLKRIPTDTPIGVRNRAIMEVLYSTGIRRKELAGIRLDEADLEQGLIRITRGKGGKQRIAPIGAHAAHWIQVYLASSRPALMSRCRDDHGMLFVSHNGRPFSAAQVTNIVRSITTKILGEDKRLTPHAFRRSFATELIRNGANPGHVKDLLGQEDFSSLKHYIRLVAADLKEALRKFHPRERRDKA
jgi:integrase/recombinase XerD